MKGVHPLSLLLLSQTLAHSARHVLEVGQDALVKVLRVDILALLHQLSCNIPDPLIIVHDALKCFRVVADRVALNLVHLEAHVDVVTNVSLLLRGLVDEVLRVVIGTFVVETGKPDIRYLPTLHGP